MLQMYLVVTIVLIVMLIQAISGPRREKSSPDGVVEDDLYYMQELCDRLERRIQTLERLASDQDRDLRNKFRDLD